MRSKLSGLVILVGLLLYVPAFGGVNFGPNVETDTSDYFTIMNYFLSPYQLMDYNFLGSGARARSMGGAFMAISDDPTAASWNPAGLVQLDKAQMNLSFSSFMGKRSYSTTLDSRLNYGDETDHDVNAISFASVVIPFDLRDKEMVAGVLYQRIADIYQENRYYLEADSITFVDTTIYNYLFDPIDDKVTGRLDKINLSLATKLFGSLAAGLGVNIYSGNFTAKSHWLASYDNGQNGLRFYPQIKTDYSGANFTTGLMYITEKLRLAGVLKTPFKLKEKNDGKFFADQIIEGVVVEWSYLFSPLLPLETQREWKMPTMIGFGAAYQAKSLTLSADVEFRNYSKSEVTYKRNVWDPNTNDVTTGGYLTNDWWVEEGREPPAVRSLGWRNLTQLRLGAEYVINTNFASIPLRVGFRNDPQLYTTKLDSSWVYVRADLDGDRLMQSMRGVEKGDWVNGNIFSFGTGLAWSQIKLDITVEYAKYDDVTRKVITGIIPFDPGERLSLEPLTTREFSQTLTNKFSRIIVSFTGFF
jgi:long-subunit fatty acid transport protein